MSGKEECNVCRAMLESASRQTSSVELATQRTGSEAAPAEPTSPAAAGKYVSKFYLFFFFLDDDFVPLFSLFSLFSSSLALSLCVSLCLFSHA